MGKGTGLGLATIYGIVKQNNGFINVYSERGHGSVFKIYLPRHQGVVKQAEKEELRESQDQGHETILLVEDEPAILKMTTAMLERLGYTVLAASAPSEALVLAKKKCCGYSIIDHRCGHAAYEWPDSFSESSGPLSGSQGSFHVGIHCQYDSASWHIGSRGSFYRETIFEARSGV